MINIGKQMMVADFYRNQQLIKKKDEPKVNEQKTDMEMLRDDSLRKDEAVAEVDGVTLTISAEGMNNQETIVEDNNKTEEVEEKESEIESESVSTSIGVNAGKLARKIAAAKTRGQLQMVIAEIRSDLEQVEAGLESGMCDETEVEKVKNLLAMAENKMGQVEDREPTPEEENAFALASLM